jgi:nitroreductase
MDYFELIKERKSIRDFSDEKIPEEDMKKIIKAAISAPSAGNLQAYEIFVITNDEKKEKLMRASFDQESVEEASFCLVFCASPGRSRQKYGERGAELYSVQDATIAAAYAQLAVAALGYGSVWVGGFEPDKVSEVLETDDSLMPVAILPVGAPEEKPKKTSRRDFDDITHYLT